MFGIVGFSIDRCPIISYKAPNGTHVRSDKVVGTSSPWNTVRSNVIRIDRIVELPIKTMDDIARENEGLDLAECLRSKPTLADDWREVISEIRGSPLSHALVALAAIVGWSVLIVAPTLLGVWG